jgi:hypothetical protein
VQDDHIILGQHHVVFVSQGRRETLNQIEKTGPPLRDVRAVLDVVRRPQSFGGFVISLVEQRVKRHQSERFSFI